jgi:hypothetical protein
MPTTTRHVAVSAAIMLAALGFSGCSTGNNATITHNPPLSTFGGKSTARSGVQTAIFAAQGSTGLAVPGGMTPAAIARRFLASSTGRRTSATGTSVGPCLNGTKTSQVTNADGSTDTTTDVYYQATCVTLESEELVHDVTPGATTDSGTGSITTYDTSGNVTSYHVLALNLAPTSGVTGSETITVHDTYSTSNGGTTLGAVGASCVGSPNSPGMTCSLAQAGSASSQGFGQAIQLIGVAGTGGAKNSVTISTVYYDGNGLGIQQTAATWGVTGGASFNAGSGTYTYTTTGTSGSGNLTLTDSVYTYTETATLSATGLSVTIVRGTDPIATATIDLAGNGIINYADGSADVVAAGIVGA